MGFVQDPQYVQLHTAAVLMSLGCTEPVCGTRKVPIQNFSMPSQSSNPSRSPREPAPEPEPKSLCPTERPIEEIVGPLKLPIEDVSAMYDALKERALNAGSADLSKNFDSDNDGDLLGFSLDSDG